MCPRLRRLLPGSFRLASFPRLPPPSLTALPRPDAAERLINTESIARRASNLLRCFCIMTTIDKKIVVIDEYGFSRVCCALFDGIGYGTERLPAMNTLPTHLNADECGLLVMSYPYGEPLLDQLKEKKIPTIILSDTIDARLLSLLKSFENSYCMIKPLDYERFIALVKGVMNGELGPQAGFEIV